MKKSEQKLTLTLEDDVISGFSLSFTKSLLKKLEELKRLDRIFDDSAEDIEEKDKKGYSSPLTSIANSVVKHLVDQLQTFGGDSACRPDDINKLIALAYEFIEIFEKKKQITQVS